jgi:hypothetical protein
MTVSILFHVITLFLLGSLRIMHFTDSEIPSI